MITSVISLGNSVLPKLSLLSERLINSFSDKLGILLIFYIVKWIVIWRNIGTFFSNDAIMGKQNCVFHHGVIIVPKHFSLLTFALAAPTRLKGGNAYKLNSDHDILNASIATAFLFGCHEAYCPI